MILNDLLAILTDSPQRIKLIREDGFSAYLDDIPDVAAYYNYLVTSAAIRFSPAENPLAELDITIAAPTTVDDFYRPSTNRF